MFELLRFFLFVSLIITNPLESISITNYQNPGTSISFLNDLYYIAPDNGYVNYIEENDGLFLIKLSLDNGMLIDQQYNVYQRNA